MSKLNPKVKPYEYQSKIFSALTLAILDNVTYQIWNSFQANFWIQMNTIQGREIILKSKCDCKRFCYSRPSIPTSTLLVSYYHTILCPTSLFLDSQFLLIWYSQYFESKHQLQKAQDQIHVLLCIKEGRDTIDPPTPKINYYYYVHIEDKNLFGTYFPWTTSEISTLRISRNEQPILSFPGQPPRFHIWNFQWILVSNQGGPCSLWATSSKDEQQHVYYSLWATNYFSLKFFSKSKMCQRGPGDAGRTLYL